MRPLRALPGNRDPGDHAFYFNTWYRGHTNARYAELLPRLERVDPYLLTFPSGRLPRAAAERSWRLVRGQVEPRVVRIAERGYRYAFATDVRQLPLLSVRTLVDVDDLDFTPENAALLSGRGVAAYVVTAESAGRRLEQLGVELPWHVVPQGAALDLLTADAVRDVARRTRERDPRPVVGYVSAFMLLTGDRGGDDPLYGIEHVLDLWEGIRARVDARLWLIGESSERVRARLAGRDDIELFGRLPRSRMLATLSNVDVGLYPRQTGRGIRASKIAEYLGCGVPVVGYDYPVIEDVREARAGLLVRDSRDFVGAVARLLTDEATRSRLAGGAREEGARRDWRVLAARYAEILDEHLPRLASLH